MTDRRSAMSLGSRADSMLAASLSAKPWRQVKRYLLLKRPRPERAPIPRHPRPDHKSLKLRQQPRTSSMDCSGFLFAAVNGPADNLRGCRANAVILSQFQARTSGLGLPISPIVGFFFGLSHFHPERSSARRRQTKDEPFVGGKPRARLGENHLTNCLFRD